MSQTQTTKFITGYKLFRVRKDGSLGSLFINRRARIPIGRWLAAKSFPTPGFAVRKGFHACQEPNASHLSTKGRSWYKVLLRGVTTLNRPINQGGVWYVAKHMKVVKEET